MTAGLVSRFLHRPGQRAVAGVVMVPEVTAMLHVAQEQGPAMVRGLEMLTKQIEILADFVEIAN